MSTSNMISAAIRWLLCVTLLVGLPLLGLPDAGRHAASYLEFPPLTRYVPHAPFSFIAFVIIGLLDLLMALGVILMFRQAFRRRNRTPSCRPEKAAFPAWGRLGLVVMLAGWFLAWTRFQWFEPLQAHTFCLPWMGYILLANALCVWRSGHSLLTDAPGRFLLLWPASAVFWWFFEYLNRFVQNWYYVGVDDFSAGEYILHASLAFSTVLPAVLSTHRFLLTFSVFHSGLKSIARIPIRHSRPTAGIIFLAACGGLVFIGRFPDLFYPLVWAAPLLVITSMNSLWRRPTLFTGLRWGDWRAIAASAVAALICGFFWELWNFYSLARWEYAIPFVDRFHIFAMPLLGYGGYLPFGLECLLIGRIILGNRPLAISSTPP